jgi:multidrug/hemolysin transport system permease protein
MHKFLSLTKRNIKVYFSDKSMFFVSLITPAILLILYSSFLGTVFKDTFLSLIPEGLEISTKIINSLVSGQILSSLLSVSCITVAFTSNLLMVTDKVNGISKDINTSPISKGMISLSYFVASFASTIIVNIVALLLCLVYTYTQGWFYSLSDIFILLGDIIILTLFGCALSSAINYNLKSQGQVSAVGTIVSAGYGFICGAYMPMSSFSAGLQKVLLFLPGTYGTSLIRNHSLNAALNELSNSNIPSEVIEKMKDGLDCNLSFFDKNISVSNMYLIMIITIILLLFIFVLENKIKKNK